MYENVKNSRMLVKLIKRRHDQADQTMEPKLQSKLLMKNETVSSDKSEESSGFSNDTFLFLKEEAGKLFHRYKNNDSSNKNITPRD